MGLRAPEKFQHGSSVESDRWLGKVCCCTFSLRLITIWMRPLLWASVGEVDHVSSRQRLGQDSRARALCTWAPDDLSMLNTCEQELKSRPGMKSSILQKEPWDGSSVWKVCGHNLLPSTEAWTRGILHEGQSYAWFDVKILSLTFPICRCEQTFCIRLLYSLFVSVVWFKPTCSVINLIHNSLFTNYYLYREFSIQIGQKGLIYYFFEQQLWR